MIKLSNAHSSIKQRNLIDSFLYNNMTNKGNTFYVLGTNMSTAHTRCF